MPARRSLRLLPLLVVGIGASSVQAAEPDCGDLTPALATGQRPDDRPIQVDDLVRLRDVGWPPSVAASGVNPISISPDGTKVAFQIRRADPDANAYCLGIYVAPIEAGAKLVEVDRGGELIRTTLDRTGITDFPTGVPKVISPHWSPDGAWIAFLKRQGDVTQVWRAKADGSISEPITRSDIDIEDFAWSRDGRALVVATRPGLREARTMHEAEARRGYRFDDRFVPKASNRPFPRFPVPFVYSALDLDKRDLRPATASEQALLDPSTDSVKPVGAHLFAAGPGEAMAWTQARDPSAYISVSELLARRPDGRQFRCAAETCTYVIDLWWMPESGSIRFMRRDGWGLGQIALYSWKPGDGEPRRMFATDDVLANCQPVGQDLLCLHEAAAQPRRLVLVGPRGQIRPLINFNPEAEALQMGSVQRLRWRNEFGIETFGDLVLPPVQEASGRLPLIVVQYDSRGFLRGGTGDEYPIHPLAMNGFAVLSFERPRAIGLSMPARDGDELVRNNMSDWIDLRSVLSSLEIAIDLLVDRGIVAPRRIGIAGLSDGTRNIQYALLHSNRFAAASVSSSFEESGTLIPLAGPGGERNYVASGYPARGDEGQEFWRCYSIAQNAPRMRTPILMQLAQDEYLGALETLAALRRHRVPSALYVFPGEHHVKWQPAHRLSVYNRNLAWFLHWLQPGRASPFVDMWLGDAQLGPAASRAETRELAASDQCRTQASASTRARIRR